MAEPDERRRDPETRSRLERIEESYQAIADAATEQSKAYAATTAIVARGQRIQAVMFVIVLVLVLAFGGTLYVLHQQGTRRARDTAHLLVEAKQSTLTTCTLLSNLAGQAGIVGAGGTASPATVAQKQLVAIVFDVAKRHMTYNERYRFRKYYRQFLSGGPFVTLPDCQQVADNPESVLQTGSTTKQKLKP